MFFKLANIFPVIKRQDSNQLLVVLAFRPISLRFQESIIVIFNLKIPGLSIMQIRIVVIITVIKEMMPCSGLVLPHL